MLQIQLSLSTFPVLKNWIELKTQYKKKDQINYGIVLNQANCSHPQNKDSILHARCKQPFKRESQQKGILDYRIILIELN